ncbi:glycoside hydrolase family 92 protein [Flammeovirga sp. MY04]|uniref:GH92 family glycosyl hydrolase n=1 Tax=Flammeovirga sp. MY04 TaxID=1191459 RepID=UPI000826F70D|nr:GH92 family glycosyl hydrolase [Flammeovirga sp. MY04]ANQ52808.2 glycoside hydrolase family 92 protein [Flammeovirga sp. MY04]
MRFFQFLILPFLLLVGCKKYNDNTSEETTSVLSYVNPFIGTGYHGHTFPGATTPNALVQLSPDTRLKGWDACGGYHYSDSSIIGFSHTHLSGTGIADLGDILIMPFTGEAKLNMGSAENPDEGYRSRFTHENEMATPGYYQVDLEDYDIKAELTASSRAGFHQYTFPEAEKAGIILDLTPTLANHNNPKHIINIVSDTEISGLKYTKGWAREHYVYFYAKFEKPFTHQIYSGNNKVVSDNFEGKNAKAVLTFSTKNNEAVKVKVGISSVDIAGAKKNLEAEINHWEFDQTKLEAEKAWLEKMALIDIKGKDEKQKEIFYTSMYHAFIAPMTFSDVDKRHRTIDGKIAEGESYTVFSLWDTFRAFHPLMTIIEPTQNQAYIRSLLQKYDEGGILPKWELWGNYTGTMTGYHSVPVIVDAYMKGQRDFDVEKAFEAMLKASRFDSTYNFVYHDEIIKEKVMPMAKYYNDQLGYIPSDLENESVSKALEFAYNDFCIAQMAKELGKEDIHKEYLERSKRYTQYFDKKTGYMRGKLSTGGWREPFDPRYSRHRKDDYTEGNAFQWSWFVPHDVEGLTELVGGEKLMEEKLDTLFLTSSELAGEHASADITGMVGQYAHGNEPSHHISYLYNYIGAQSKTQYMVDYLLQNHYQATPEGIIGNEDCGQMSAWFILSSMGFYQVSPGTTTYAIGRPLFDEVNINLENGKVFTVRAQNNSKENKYIEKMMLDGKELTTPFIQHQDIMDGKTLEFVMTNEPQDGKKLI